MSDFDPKAIYKAMSDDELAGLAIDLKEQAFNLRQTIWAVEDELRNRLITNNAKRLQGTKYLVKSSVKREIVWDQDGIDRVGVKASEEGHSSLFFRAFPQVFAPRLRELNELLKFGGETARAIEAAKLEVKEKIELSFETL